MVRCAEAALMLINQHHTAAAASVGLLVGICAGAIISREYKHTHAHIPPQCDSPASPSAGRESPVLVLLACSSELGTDFSEILCKILVQFSFV
jgi:hypothetical protein